MSETKAAIRSIVSFLPEGRLTNEQLAQEYRDWDAEKILQKTGIRVRAIAGPAETSVDLGVKAGEKLLSSGACSPEDVDFLLFCTQSPDYFLPTSACIVQDRLGLRTDCGAFDFNLGCSGFVYGLYAAKGFIESGLAQNVLLITAETYSKFIHPRDKSARTIFGDGAAATLVSAVDAGAELIGPFVLGTDGRGARNLIVPAGGMRTRPTDQTKAEQTDALGSVRSEENLYMNGPEIFNFTIQAVPRAVQQLLDRAHLSLDGVDHFVFHQANKYMLDYLRKKIGIPQEKFCINLELCGNTVSATIPMALEGMRASGAVRPDNRLMLVGFGVGYSWGACLVKIPEE